MHCSGIFSISPTTKMKIVMKMNVNRLHVDKWTLLQSRVSVQVDGVRQLLP